MTQEVLNFCKHIAGSCEIDAAFVDGGLAFGLPKSKSTLHVSAIIRRFQPRLMNYVTVIDNTTIIVVAVDSWVFERDVDRGFLGEALSGGLIFGYQPLINKAYLHDQELHLKKRLARELLASLAIDFPELSYEFCIRPEYFGHEIMLTRIRLFPAIMYTAKGTAKKGHVRKDIDAGLGVFVQALKELEKDGAITFSNGHVRMSKEFVDAVKGQRNRFVNLFRTGQRTLFMSILAIFPRMMNILSRNRTTLFRIRDEILRPRPQLEDPENYVFVHTATGLAPLANRMDVEAFARKVLCADEGAEVKIETIGGILNDVFLVRTLVQGKEQKAVVKRFRDWSSFKWFPLTLWAAGTRSFAVLANSRLEKECAINQLLDSKGFAVPKILYITPNKRLVFMQYVEGEGVHKTIKRIASSKSVSQVEKDLETIGRVGQLFADIHSFDIALGDTKPENILIGSKSQIYLTDLEQARRGGDKVWDIAEFLYYAGHDAFPAAETSRVQRAAEAFIKGYLEAGGDIKTVKQAGNPKYTKVFSVFTFPHLILALSNVCKKAEKLTP